MYDMLLLAYGIFKSGYQVEMIISAVEACEFAYYGFVFQPRRS